MMEDYDQYFYEPYEFLDYLVTFWVRIIDKRQFNQ